jgi:hypothetical protein
LEYISTNVGLRWAKGIAGVLQGDFRLHGSDLLPNADEQNEWVTRIDHARYSRKIVSIENQAPEMADARTDIEAGAECLGRAIADNARKGVHKPARFLGGKQGAYSDPATKAQSGRQLKWVGSGAQKYGQAKVLSG